MTARVPVIVSRDERYFTDRHQAMPADGYAAAKVRELDTYINLHLELVARNLYPQALFGGSTEAVALQFKKSGFETGFFYVLAGAQLIAFVCALLMRDSQKHSLIADD